MPCMYLSDFYTFFIIVNKYEPMYRIKFATKTLQVYSKAKSSDKPKKTTL